jgi:hypothetical protein
MKPRHFRVLVLAGIAFAASAEVASAQERVALAWKFNPGEAFYVERTVETRQTMKVMGADITQSFGVTFWYRWTPGATPDGNQVIAVRILGCKAHQQVGASALPGRSPLDSLPGAELVITVHPDQRVAKVAGVAALHDRLRDDPNFLLLKASFSETSFQQDFEELLEVLPAGAGVRAGDSWQRQRVLNQAVGRYETTRKYTYQGKQGNKDKITIQTSQKYRPPLPAEVAQGSFRVHSADSKRADGAGVVFVDPVRGRIVSSEEDVYFEGELTVDIAGQRTVVGLIDHQHHRVNITDTNPLK